MSVAGVHNLPKLRLSPKKVISPQIHDFLRKQITETNLKPGTILSENSLSEHFNVSRQPVREALMRLSYEGLLSVLPQRGSIVEQICIKELYQTVFVRCAIEKECVRHFAVLEDADKEFYLSQLEKVLAMQRNIIHDAKIKSEYLRLDDLFHKKLCSISGADMAWDTVQGIKGQMDRIRFLSFELRGHTEDITNEHQHIYDALLSGDVDKAVELLHAHLCGILDTHKEIMRNFSDWFTPESMALISGDIAGLDDEDVYESIDDDDDL